MQTKATHKIRPEEQTVNLSRMSLASIHEMQRIFQNHINQAILAQFPSIYDDAVALLKRFNGYEQQKGIELTDKELYTLYICLDLMGRVLTSSYWDALFDTMPKKEEGLEDPGAQRLILQMAAPNIDNFFKLTEQYAEQTNSLKKLPRIKEQLRQLPIFD